MIQHDPILEAMTGPEPAPYQPPTLLERIRANAQPTGPTLLERVKAKARPKPLEYVEEAGGSLASSALEGFAGLVEAPSRVRREVMGETIGSVRKADMTLGEAAGEWLRRQSQGLRNEIVENSQPEGAAGRAAKFLSRDVAGAVGSTIPAATGGVLAAAAGIPPWIGVAASGAATNGAAAAYEAQYMGATPEQQWTAFWTNAAVGTTEAVPVAGQVGRILGRADKLSGGWLRKALIEGGEELAQETVQQTAGNWIAQAVAGYDQDRKLLEGVAESGGAGGLSGMILSALSGVRVAGSRNTQRNATPTDSATFTEEPVEATTNDLSKPGSVSSSEPFGNSEGLDLTGQSGAVAEQTTGAAPLPVTSPSGDAGAAATIDKPQAVEPAPDAGSRREQTPAALETPPVSRTSESARLVEGAVEPGATLDAREPEGDPDRTDTLPGEQGYLQEAVKRAAPEPSSEADTFGLRHEDTTKYRAERGLGEYEGRQGGLSDVDRHAKAVETFKSDPHAGRKLVERLAETGEAGSDQDAALLLLEEHRTRLEVEAAEKAYTENPTAENKAAVDKSFADFKRTMDVMDQAGSEGGARLRAQRDRIKYDYSFAAQLRKHEVANGGEPVSAEERAKIKKDTDAVARAAEKAAQAETQGELERQNAALKERVAELERSNTVRGKRRERTRGIEKNKQAVRDIWGEWKRRTSVARGGFVPIAEDVVLLGKLAAETIKLGFNTFAKFSAEVKEHLEESRHREAWNEGLKVIRADLAAPLEKRLKSGAKLTDLRTYIDQITESFYVDGVTDSDKLADAVHGVLKVADPSITREQTVAAISHYGEFKQLSQEEPAKGLRTIRGELRETAKLADLAKGIPPKKTGVEYPEPSGKQRRLAKRVREEMKRLGIRTTDAATQLKSALESAKTRARNRIDDLTTAIDTRTQIKNGERVAVSDAELVELKAKRTELEKVYADLFQGPKDDPKIRTLVDSIADLDTRIAAGDTSTRGPKQGPEPRADIAALKAERAEKAKTLAEMRKAADAKTSEERIADQVKKLETRRDALKGKLFDAGEGGSVAPTGTKQGPDVARVAELKAEIASLNETIGDIRDAQNPKLSDEARATASHERRAARRLADTQAVMRSGNFEKPTRQTEERIKSPTEIETLTELALAKRIVDRGRYETEQRKRTLRRKVLDAALAPFKAVKSIFSSTDFSAVGRQGAFFTAQDMILPNRWPMLARRLGRMFHAFASEKAFEEFNTELQHDPAYPILTKGGMQFTGMHDPLTAKEELFQSDLAERILVLKHLVKASNRAYVSYLNLLRLEHGKRILAASDGSKEAVQQTAKLVNAATGRANMKPGAFKNTVQASGNFLWAPNLYVSRFQLLAGEPLWGGNAHTRKLVLKEYAKTAAALASMYALIDIYRRMNPDDDDAPTVTWDPHSPDFGKIKFGNTRLDPLFGLSQTARLVYREGESFIAPSKGDNPFKIGEQFLERKFTPTISVPYELITEKELGFYGRAKPRPQNIGEAIQRIAPLSVQDVLDTMQEQGVPRGAALTVLSIFGMSLQTYEDNKK